MLLSIVAFIFGFISDDLLIKYKSVIAFILITLSTLTFINELMPALGNKIIKKRNYAITIVIGLIVAVIALTISIFSNISNDVNIISMIQILSYLMIIFVVYPSTKKRS